MRLIAISGKMGSGKDTLTNIILNYFINKNIKCKNIKFADNLKKSSSLITNTTIFDNYNNKDVLIENLNMSIGRFQQIFGTLMRENVNSDIWVYPVIDFYLNNPDTICVISDCRFKNEAKMIKNNGGLIFRINKENKSENTRDSEHISETDMDDYCDYDLVINNNGSIEDLEKIINSYLNFL